MAERVAGKHSADRPFLVREAGLVFGLSTMGIFQVFGSPWVANLESALKAVSLFVWLFLAILTLSFGVVRHADALAVLLGEPYGTLILTLSVIGIEAAMMAQLMLNGEDSPKNVDCLNSLAVFLSEEMVCSALLGGGDGQTDGRTDGRAGGWMTDGWTDGQRETGSYETETEKAA